MSGETNVLLSGFEPFGGRSINTSEQLARSVAAATIPGVRLSTVILPVCWSTAAGILIAACRQQKPQALLCLGESGVADRLLVERRAVNAADFALVDNTGAAPVSPVIAPDAPGMYLTRVPHEELAAAIESVGCPASVSDDMGRYLCNHVMFAALHATRAHSRMPAGFIHVPATASDRQDSLPRFARGIAAAVTTLARQATPTRG